jgi:subtilisin family serine protease
MENINTGMDLLKGIPSAVKSKLNISLIGLQQVENPIEVIVLYGEAYEEVNSFVSQIGGKLENLGYGYGIVTINIEKLVDLAKQPNIQYIELPKNLFLSDLGSNRATCVERVNSELGLRGEGILIGFIDTGIDYTHLAFRKEDGTTRVQYIYDLSLGGTIYNSQQINEALKAQDPLSVVPSYDLIEHGTHVAGIACAGGKIDFKYYGVAPDSSIMMVKSGRGLFSLSTQIMRGIKFLIDKGKELKMPLVINMSLSTNDGAHNGTSLLERYISTIASLERVTIVIAAGNEGNAAHHVGGILKLENSIKFNVAQDETAVVINLYKSILPQITIEIITPTGITTGPIKGEEGYIEGVISGNRYVIYNTGPRPFDISGGIEISLISRGNFILSGQWTIIIRVVNNRQGIYDMWLPISEGLNQKTKFSTPTVDNTLGIPATVQNVISVGSYNYITRNISPFSGRGKPSLYYEFKPDLVAPGEGITAPIPNSSFDAKSGTSMASPHVAGISGLMMEWGILKGNDPYLFGDRLKYYLIAGAKRERADIPYPDISFGYGEVCMYDSIQILRDILNIIYTSSPGSEVRNIEDIKEYNIGGLFIRMP